MNMLGIIYPVFAQHWKSSHLLQKWSKWLDDNILRWTLKGGKVHCSQYDPKLWVYKQDKKLECIVPRFGREPPSFPAVATLRTCACLRHHPSPCRRSGRQSSPGCWPSSWPSCLPATLIWQFESPDRHTWNPHRVSFAVNDIEIENIGDASTTILCFCAGFFFDKHLSVLPGSLSCQP